MLANEVDDANIVAVRQRSGTNKTQKNMAGGGTLRLQGSRWKDGASTSGEK